MIFARIEAKPDQPDDGTVFEIAEADTVFDIVWTEEAISWGIIEVTEETGIARIGDRYEEGKFVRV